MRQAAFRLRAVLLDMDGVLIDSQPNHVRAWQAVFAARGVALDAMLPLQREGEKALDTCAWICRELGLDWDSREREALVAEKRRIFRALPGSDVFPGAVDLLDGLAARGLPAALVTGSTVVNARALVPAALWARFGAVVTAEDVARGKPDPEGYRKAAAALGVTPDSCLAVENAPFGIQAARAAGCRVLALTTTLPAEWLAEADEISGRHEVVLEIVDGLSRRR
ncbi:MAG: HAD family phosphatase [bacterium]|nr:HAD family phosphatase [bacterium]